MCREEAKEDEYRAAGATRVVALVKEDVDKEVEEFRKDFWPEEVFMDKDRGFYKALGGGEVWEPIGIFGFLAILLNPFSSNRLKANIKRNQAKKLPSNMVGEGFVAGGCYVLNKSGEPVFAHLEENFGDHAKPEDIIDALKNKV
mmetsp:Transcript_120330/g.169302  ORF Transcript_120330/g.169302 Transcript_120330/m.169302 type:complete len:144 (+) Transcript_120330:70-501(+)